MAIRFKYGGYCRVAKKVGYQIKRSPTAIDHEIMVHGLGQWRSTRETALSDNMDIAGTQLLAKLVHVANAVSGFIKNLLLHDQSTSRI